MNDRRDFSLFDTVSISENRNLGDYSLSSTYGLNIEMTANDSTSYITAHNISINSYGLSSSSVNVNTLYNVKSGSNYKKVNATDSYIDNKFYYQFFFLLLIF